LTTASFLTVTSTSHEKAASSPTVPKVVPTESAPAPVAAPVATPAVSSPPTLNQPGPPSMSNTAVAALSPAVALSTSKSAASMPGATSNHFPKVSQSGQTIIAGTTYIPASPLTASIPSQASPTIISGKTFVVASPSPTTSAAPIVIAGTTFSATMLRAGTVPAYIVDGKTLAIGSTITVGSGPAAQTIVLKTDSNGNSFLVAGTSTSIITSPVKTTSPGIGDYIGSGLGGVAPSGSGPAMQTTNVAPALLKSLNVVVGIFIGLIVVF